MNKEEMICKNCKYHYIEDISFDYPQSCCSKRQCTTEQWCKCYDFEYSYRYVEQLQQENQKYKEVIDEVSSQIKLYGKYDGKKCTRCFSMMTADFNKLLDILKEVE